MRHFFITKMEIKLKISFLYVVLGSLVLIADGSPVDSLLRFVKRETPCIALGNCPGMNPPSHSSSTPPAPLPTTQNPNPSTAAPSPSTPPTPPATSTT